MLPIFGSSMSVGEKFGKDTSNTSAGPSTVDQSVAATETTRPTFSVQDVLDAVKKLVNPEPVDENEPLLAETEFMLRDELAETELLAIKDSSGREWKVPRLLAVSASGTIPEHVYTGEPRKARRSIDHLAISVYLHTMIGPCYSERNSNIE